MSSTFIQQISEINVASTSNFGEHYASSVFKATVKHSDKFSGDEIVTKLFVKRIIPKVNAFTDENSFDTGMICCNYMKIEKLYFSKY